jgi:hypothetical protein
MTMRSLLTFSILTLLVPGALLAGATDTAPVVRYSVEGKYENVREDLINAITGRGLSFCSSVISRKTMEADPHNILFCPYTIALYTTVGEPKKVYLAFRRPQRADDSAASKAALKEVEALLDGIAREALNLK